MREEKMKESLERDDFFTDIRAASNLQKPEVMIMRANDATTANGVTKHQNRQQLTEALVRFGEDRRTVESDLERIYNPRAPVEGDPMAGESACYTRNITIAQARDFGWED